MTGITQTLTDRSNRYGRFTLTEAIRPGWQLDVVPQAGYRYDAYVDPATGTRLPAFAQA